MRMSRQPFVSLWQLRHRRNLAPPTTDTLEGYRDCVKWAAVYLGVLSYWNKQHYESQDCVCWPRSRPAVGEDWRSRTQTRGATRIGGGSRWPVDVERLQVSVDCWQSQLQRAYPAPTSTSWKIPRRSQWYRNMVVQRLLWARAGRGSGQTENYVEPPPPPPRLTRGARGRRHTPPAPYPLRGREAQIAGIRKQSASGYPITVETPAAAIAHWWKPANPCSSCCQYSYLSTSGGSKVSFCSYHACAHWSRAGSAESAFTPWRLLTFFTQYCK